MEINTTPRQERGQTKKRRGGKEERHHDHVLQRRVPASGVASGPPLRVPRPPRLDRRRRHLDRRVAAVVHMPVLPLRDDSGGAGDRADQGAAPRDGVVHLPDPLLRVSTLKELI